MKTPEEIMSEIEKCIDCKNSTGIPKRCGKHLQESFDAILGVGEKPILSPYQL